MDDYDSLKEKFDRLQEVYYEMRKDAFVSRVAYSNGLVLAGLVSQCDETIKVETLHRWGNDFLNGIKSAKKSIQQVYDGDEELARYFDMAPPLTKNED
tara:strand:+ start:9986 stop:10279 length:294 start_codon:yes stop_codon:yes gene_type:complete